ncbi:hypothetical protein P7K49_021597 [Saguinus oedipus]|uniref:Uncharacterized protein n=1 Tax=Saguinus oedipus TaxID=9490 RepID=A0ABQ9UT24_SAGOE|nr:hypothetical protein P7K49_021597 [Saguinus oedipus]
MAGAQPGVHALQLEPPTVVETLRRGSKFIKWDELDQTPGTPHPSLACPWRNPHSSLAALRKLKSPIVPVMKTLFPQPPAPQPWKIWLHSLAQRLRTPIDLVRIQSPFPPLLARLILVPRSWPGPQTLAQHWTPGCRTLILRLALGILIPGVCQGAPTLPGVLPEQSLPIHHFSPCSGWHPFALLLDPSPAPCPGGSTQSPPSGDFAPQVPPPWELCSPLLRLGTLNPNTSWLPFLCPAAGASQMLRSPLLAAHPHPGSPPLSHESLLPQGLHPAGLSFLRAPSQSGYGPGRLWALFRLGGAPGSMPILRKQSLPWETSSRNLVTLRVDPNGFFLYWTGPNMPLIPSLASGSPQEVDTLDISSIRDTRTGRYARLPKDPKIREVLGFGGPDARLEEKLMTVVSGPDPVNTVFLNFMAVQDDTAKVWSEELFKLAMNILAQNASRNTFLRKAYTKLKLQVNQDGRIPVKK